VTDTSSANVTLHDLHRAPIADAEDLDLSSDAAKQRLSRTDPSPVRRRPRDDGSFLVTRRSADRRRSLIQEVRIVTTAHTDTWGREHATVTAVMDTRLYFRHGYADQTPIYLRRSPFSFALPFTLIVGVPVIARVRLPSYIFLSKGKRNENCIPQ
jgi:hypothetical protein